MKKIILTLFVAIFAAIPSFAATYNAESRVPEIGKLLLTKNGIAITNVQFKVVSDDTDNSDFTTNKTVNVSKAKLSFAGGYISEADANVVMTISDGNGENAVSIEITDTTGKTTTVWSMDGTFNPDRNRIRYTDGKKTTKKGSGSRDVVYEDGRGSLTIESDGSIVWKSKNDGDGKEVVFQPDDADQENS